ncbi:MAG: NEW3 domain-containing protein [Chloroflexota bacterium]
MKAIRLFIFCLVVVGLLAISLPGFVLAQGETAPTEVTQPPETLNLAPTYPKLEAVAGGSFTFEVGFKYQGNDARVFDMQVTTPSGWQVYITPQYQTSTKITALRLEPGYSFSDKVEVVVSSPYYPIPDPGEYKITFAASSGDLKASTELTAVITASYSMSMSSDSGLYNTTATAGESRTFSMKLSNLGTAAISNITFSPTKPDGWDITFTPDKIDTLDPVSQQSVGVNIKPPPKAIAGDYVITVRASGKEASADQQQIRVTVESPTIWGWVGVAIILLVVAGLVVIFMRFSRR